LEGVDLVATSGTTTFALQIDDIVEEAYERCGKEQRSGYDLKTAKRSLNLLLQNLQNEHPALWKEALTSQTLVQGTVSYTLDAKILEISSVVLRRSSIDTKMLRISRDEYQNRPNKTTQSRPSQFFFEKLTTPVLHVYPAPENATDTIRFYARERIEDIGAYTNTIDVPSNLLPVIVSGLAYMLAMKTSPDRLQYLKPVYDEEKLRLKQIDSESIDVRIVPGA
jgi:hypothetical protein